MHVEESIEIARDLPEVFDYVADVRNYPEWMAHVLEVQSTAAAPPQESHRFVVAIKSVGRRFETPYERDLIEPGRRYTDRAVGGPVPDQRWHCTFEEAGGGTRVTRAVDVEASGVLKLLEPLQKHAAGRQLKKDLQTLKDRLEARG